MPTEQDARETMLALLARRAADATICPSEVARALCAAGADSVAGGWREHMPVVHAAADAMLAQRLVRISWKGKTLEQRAGPYRIARP